MDKQAENTERDAAFAITVEFEIVEGSYDAFYQLVCENAALSVELEPGCLRFDVLMPVKAGAARVLLYEIYQSRADFAAHLQMAHYLAFDRTTRDMVRTKTVENFRLTEHAKGLGFA